MHRIALVIALGTSTLVGCDDSSKPAPATTPAAAGGAEQKVTPPEARTQPGRAARKTLPSVAKPSTGTVD